MGPLLVVQAPIVLDDDAGFGDGKEDFWRKTFGSKTAMKTFDDAILPRAARLDIKRLNLGGSAPVLNAPGLPFFSIDCFQHPIIQHGFGQHLFQLGVFFFLGLTHGGLV